jgi:hypothetical protein
MNIVVQKATKSQMSRSHDVANNLAVSKPLLSSALMSSDVLKANHSSVSGFGKANSVRHLPEHSIENLMRKVNRLVDCLTGGDHPHVYLLLTRQTDTSDETRAQVDHTAIDAGHPCVGVKHGYLAPPCAERTGFLST